MTSNSSSDDDLLRLDPELEAVLRDLARQHRDSRLFRVPRPRVHSGLFADNSAVSSRAAGLLSAERKLLESYREEIAGLLRRISFERLMCVEPARRITCLQLEGGREIRLFGERGFLRQLQTETADLHRSILDPLVATDADRATRTAEDRSALPCQLAAASLRFAPHPLARIYMGQEQLVRGSPASALRTFRSVRERTTDTRIRARASSWVAAALCRVGHFNAALLEYAALADSEYGCLGDLLSLFTVALQAGDGPMARSVCRRVEELGPTQDSAIRSWFSQAASRRLAGDWEPTRESFALLRSLQSELGTALRTVVQVFGDPYAGNAGPRTSAVLRRPSRSQISGTGTAEVAALQATNGQVD